MEEFIQSGDRAVYQGFFQKLEREKRLPEQDKAYLKEKNPELYEMVESLEQELVIYREKLKKCGSKEEVEELKESYEDGLLLGISLVESNPVLPLEKKLEYTMFKDTKLSIMEEVIGEFTKSAGYEELPDKAEKRRGKRRSGRRIGAAENQACKGCEQLRIQPEGGRSRHTGDFAF